MKAQTPSAAWSALKNYDAPNNLSEWWRLRQTFFRMQMTVG